MERTILLVDDEPAMRTAIRRLLVSRSFLVREAADGRSALELWLAARAEIDVILSDLLMPGMSGLQLLEAVRKLDPDVRVVLMTGANPPVDPSAAAPSAVVQKPFRAQALVDALASVLPSRLP